MSKETKNVKVSWSEFGFAALFLNCVENAIVPAFEAIPSIFVLGLPVFTARNSQHVAQTAFPISFK